MIGTTLLIPTPSLPLIPLGITKAIGSLPPSKVIVIVVFPLASVVATTSLMVISDPPIKDEQPVVAVPNTTRQLSSSIAFLNLFIKFSFYLALLINSSIVGAFP